MGCAKYGNSHQLEMFQYPGRPHPQGSDQQVGGLAPIPNGGSQIGHLALTWLEASQGYRYPCYLGVLGAKSLLSFNFESLGSIFGGYSEVSYKILIQTKTGKAWQALSSLWKAGFLGAWRKLPRAEPE